MGGPGAGRCVPAGRRGLRRGGPGGRGLRAGRGRDVGGVHRLQRPHGAPLPAGGRPGAGHGGRGPADPAAGHRHLRQPPPGPHDPGPRLGGGPPLLGAALHPRTAGPAPAARRHLRHPDEPGTRPRRRGRFPHPRPGPLGRRGRRDRPGHRGQHRRGPHPGRPRQDAAPGPGGVSPSRPEIVRKGR
ncbi:hypothetical protein SGPA1_50729 [Streptomyces misionensis JCM 4497]